METGTKLYEVFNTRTGQVYGRYESLKSASRRQDREDNKYGAVCTSYRAVYA